MISTISSFETINTVVPELWRIKTLSANGLSAILINRRPVYSNVPRRLPGKPSDCTILDCLSESNNLCGKLVLS